MSNKNKIKSVGVLCSGGDSPGMNCAIRAVVRTAISNGVTPYGIYRGFSGLLEGDVVEMNASSVGNILQRGGTILKTSRCPEFHEAESRKEAAHILKRKKIDALIVIGGNGSYNGAWELHKEHNIPVIGVPGTIDNDIAGTDYTIGFDTAVQTAVSAVDKIRDTAHSHARTFIVEVMGRKSAAIATHVGICTGAENVIIPSKGVDYDEITNRIFQGMKRGKNSSIIIVAEGETPGLSYTIKEELDKRFEISTRVCVLGHTQRGGSPTPLDRFLASRMGFVALEALLNGEVACATVYVNGNVQLAGLKDCLEKRDDYRPYYLDMLKTLSI